MSRSDKTARALLEAVPRVLSPPLNMFPPNTPSNLYQSNVDHFLNHRRWAGVLLSSSDTIPFIPQCRNPASPAHDQFFGQTLLSAGRGLTHMLCFFTCEDDDALWDPTKPIEKSHTLCELGAGLSGNPDILHGGMTMAIVDEAMGSLIEINAALGKDGEVFKSVSVTASLEIKFLRPVPTGQAIIATAWVEWTERRKTRVRCVVRDQHDEKLAECASTWVAIKAKV
jgi:acyl-coenzyme A thioesterase PaaI-like protein